MISKGLFNRVAYEQGRTNSGLPVRYVVGQKHPAVTALRWINADGMQKQAKVSGEQKCVKRCGATDVTNDGQGSHEVFIIVLVLETLFKGR